MCTHWCRLGPRVLLLSPGRSLSFLPPDRMRNVPSAGLRGPACLEEPGASVRTPVSSSFTSRYLRPHVPVLNNPHAGPRWAQTPCESTVTCSYVGAHWRAQAQLGPLSRLLPRRPGAVESRFECLSGGRRNFYCRDSVCFMSTGYSPPKQTLSPKCTRRLPNALATPKHAAVALAPPRWSPRSRRSSPT